MIDNVEEPLFMSRITRQSDLLSTTFRSFGLGKINEGEVGPINWIEISAL
jgi:hypothetical protein